MPYLEDRERDEAPGRVEEVFRDVRPLGSKTAKIRVFRVLSAAFNFPQRQSKVVKVRLWYWGTFECSEQT